MASAFILLRQPSMSLKSHLCRKKRPSAYRPEGRRLALEVLESRRLLAVDFNLLKDIRISGPGSDPAKFTEVGSVVFFAANDGSSGVELWKSDGTDAGTVRVKDIRTGSSSSSPSNLMNVGGTLYFTANDGTSGVELWKTDGTDAGTV